MSLTLTKQEYSVVHRSGDEDTSFPPAQITTPPLSLQPHRILQALRRYVRAENKDRQHTIRHYQHVLAVDPEKAAQMKSQVSGFLLRIMTLNPHIMEARSRKCLPFFWLELI